MANAVTEVRLLNVPLENDYLHTLFFGSKADQQEYFLGKSTANRTYSNITFQRKNNFIRIPDYYDNLLNYNYVMYKNSNKWFYAFITDIEYISDGLTEVHIETDVIQTWFFDYNVKTSFVEREHVNFDGIGYNTVPEQVEHGEYICNRHSKAGICEDDALLGDGLAIIIGSTREYSGANAKGDKYGGIYSGICYFAFNHDTDGINRVDDFLSEAANDGSTDSVVCMFLAPKKMIRYEEISGIIERSTPYFLAINSPDEISEINVKIDMTDKTLDGYTPRNKKLLTYPYRYLLASNNSGSSVVYQYEHFYSKMNGVTTGTDPRFRLDGSLCPGCSIRMVPINYKGEFRNDEEGINLGKFPVLNWTSDVYTNWLTQNAVNIGISTAGSVVSILGGVGLMFTGAGALAGAGAVMSGITGVASTMGEVYSHSLQPPQAEGNINSGDVITATGNNDFHFYDMSIKSEYAVIIDGYFDMYGYKVNKVKKPYSNHRMNYWYTKTIDVNIDGAIPMKDLQAIKNCYNKGITFWRNPDNIGDYSVNNEII